MGLPFGKVIEPQKNTLKFQSHNFSMRTRLPQITPKGNPEYPIDINRLDPVPSPGLPITRFRWPFAETRQEA